MITPDLRARVAAELDEVYDDVPYLRPTVTAVMCSALIDAATELHDAARVREESTRVDDQTAEAIVLRTLADRLSEMAKDLEVREVALTEMVREAEELGLYEMEIRACTCGRMPPCRHVDDLNHPPVEAK